MDGFSEHRELVKMHLNLRTVSPKAQGCYISIVVNRVGRLELMFWYVVSIFGAAVMVAIAATLTNTTVGPYPMALPEALILIAASIVALRAVLSRFHDIGWSGRALIVMFVPFVNVLALLFLLVVPGQKGANAYGEPTSFLQRFRKWTSA